LRFDEFVNPIGEREAGLPALPKIADEIGIVDGGFSERAGGHAGALKEVFNVGKELFGARHNEAIYRMFPISQAEKSYFPQRRKNPINSMMDAVRQLIVDRAAELERSWKEISLKIGRNHAYLHQFIRKGKPPELPEPERFALARELGVEEESLRGPEARAIRQEADSTNAQGSNRPRNQPQTDALTALIPGSHLVGSRDLPVFAASEGGKGAIILSRNPVESVARPEALARVKDGYGIIIADDSMFPALAPGDILHVHPHRPAKAGSTCVFQSKQSDGSLIKCIRFLRRQTTDAWHVTEWNCDGKLNRREYTLKKSEWQLCGVSVGKYDG
jgi:phage repressor protein C with HTH and peptisase S24 domain